MTASTASYDQLIALAQGGVDLPSPEQAKAIRIAAGLTQRELAAAIGASVDSLSRWERGEVRPEGANRTRYALFLREAARTQRQRRREMSTILGGPTMTIFGEYPEEQARADLEALAAAGEQGVTVVFAERAGKTVYMGGGVRDPGETRERFKLLARRGLATASGVKTDWENGTAIREKEHFLISPAGVAALEEASS